MGLSDDQVASMKEAFNLFDADSDGKIAPSELGILMRSLGGNPTQAQLKSIIADEKLTAPFDFQRFIRTLPYISISQKSKNNFLIPAVMAEGKEYAEVKRSHQPLPILEVLCKSTSKIRHFAAGTEAGFAVSLINKRLLSNGGSGAGGGGNCLLATHVEAVKEGEEEPISFGPSALLVDYGSGWKLQTAIESNGSMSKHLKPEPFDRQLCDAFKVLDKDGTGFVVVKELRHILTSARTSSLVVQLLRPASFFFSLPRARL